MLTADYNIMTQVYETKSPPHPKAGVLDMYPPCCRMVCFAFGGAWSLP